MRMSPSGQSLPNRDVRVKSVHPSISDIMLCCTVANVEMGQEATFVSALCTGKNAGVQGSKAGAKILSFGHALRMSKRVTLPS